MDIITLFLLVDKLLLKKRMWVESLINQPKNICQLEHSRHRNVASIL